MTPGDPHRWRTPQTPRGMPPSAWPEKRRKLYVEAIERGDREAPRPVHAPGECEECDLMRSLVDNAAAFGTVGLTERPPDPPPMGTVETNGGGAQSPTRRRLAGLSMYPGALAWLLGALVGIALTLVLGPWALAFWAVTVVIAIAAAY